MVRPVVTRSQAEGAHWLNVRAMIFRMICSTLIAGHIASARQESPLMNFLLLAIAG